MRVQNHAAGLKKALACYLAALIGISALGFGSSSLGLGQSLHARLVAQALERKLEANPNDPNLLLALGVLAMENGEERVAFNRLTKALRQDPQNPEILNSIAWLFATAKEKDLRKPREALGLAQMAVRRAPLPHIWDTLAEAYYMNGQYDNALAASRSALQAGPTERLDYFEDQLARFEKAAKENRP